MSELSPPGGSEGYAVRDDDVRCRGPQTRSKKYLYFFECFAPVFPRAPIWGQKGPGGPPGLQNRRGRWSRPGVFDPHLSPPEREGARPGPFPKKFFGRVISRRFFRLNG